MTVAQDLARLQSEVAALQRLPAQQPQVTQALEAVLQHIRTHDEVLWIASSTQSITGVSSILTPNAAVITFDTDGDYTLTSAPTIVAGVNGQALYVINVDATQTVTLKDKDFEENTGLKLGANTRALGPNGDSINFIYSSDLSAWVEQDFTNLTVIAGSLDTFTVDGLTSGTREVGTGTESAPSFVMTYTGVPTALSIDISSGGDAGSDYPQTVSTPFTSATGAAFNRNNTPGGSRIFTPTATVNSVDDSTPTMGILYNNRQYMGINTQNTTLSDTQIRALTGTDLDEDLISGIFQRALSATGSNYVWVAFPSRLGSQTMYLQGGAYIAGTTVIEASLNHTNASGHTETYRQLRSSDIGLGTQTYRWTDNKPVNQRYIGDNSTNGILNQAAIAALPTKDTDNSRFETGGWSVATTSGEYLHFYYRSTLGNTGQFFSIDNERSGFTDQGTLSFQNDQGYTETFRGWKSDISNPIDGTLRVPSSIANNRRYHGVSTQSSTLTTAQVLALDATGDGGSVLDADYEGTWTAIADETEEFIWFAFRDQLQTDNGDPRFFVDPFFGGFQDKGTVSHTNDSGYTETYRLWRSDQKALGSTTVVVDTFP